MSVCKIVAADCIRQAKTSQEPEPEAPVTWRGRLARSLLLTATLTLPAHAQLDTNANGMSDVWERQFNRDNPGELFDSANPAHHPEADPDGDGWTNHQESIAGTDPFDGNPPEGMIATQITYLKDQEEETSPEYPDGRMIDLTIISWDTLPGKEYTVVFSPDLSAGSWLAADVPYYGDGLPAAISIILTDSDGLNPDKLFWRVQVADLDSDGDGLTDYEEYLLGSNPFVWDTSGNGLPDSWDILYAGQFSVWPPNLVSNLHHNGGEQRQILLSNDTVSPVNFSITLADVSVPSYSFRDSLTDDVTYTWEEISTTGTRLANISNHLDASQYVDLNGFTFPFHGNTFSRIHISNNGLITLGAASSAFNNQSLPSTFAPANLIAPFWDDLDTRTIGDVYVKEETNLLIIQYENVGRYQGGTNSAYTFQVVLHADGRIHFRYKSMVGVINSATIGLQDSTRTIGLQVDHNVPYVIDEMALEITPLTEFFTLSPLEGTVAANSVLALDAIFQSLDITPGSHTATLTTAHNADFAPEAPIVTQATLHVINDPADITLTSPASETSILEGDPITLTATASDPQGMAKVEFYSGETKIGEQIAFSPNTSYYSYFWSQPPADAHTLTAHAIDVFGGVTISEPVTFTVYADANGNGIPDWWELEHFGNLDQTASDDFDGDGLSNLWEYQHQHLGFDPTDPTDAARDTSQNGLPDWWEITHFGVIGGIDATADPDSDGLTNLQEYQHGTDPNRWDTDGDLLPDGWEVQYGLNPLDATGDNGADGDPDEDGLSNFQEMVYGTHPMDADTDGDGVNDGDEVNQGSNPNDPSDGGQAPPEDEIQHVKIIVGDPSGSQSERWKVEVRDASTQQLLLSHSSREYGALSEEADSVFILRKRKSYTFDLRWLGTDPEVLEYDPDGEFFPDYDWALEISYKDDEENWVDVTSEENQRYLVLDPWDPQEQTLATDNVKLLVNRNELAYPWEGQPDRTEQYEQQIASKQVVIVSIGLAVDANRDGQVSFDGSDKVTSENPYHFWINSNSDIGDDAAAEDLDPSNEEFEADSQNDTINSLRDLEDFTQIALDVNLIANLITSDAIKVGFRFVNVKAGTNPRIRIFHAGGQGYNAPEFDGSKYLFDAASALAQKNHANNFARFDTGTEELATIPKTFFNGLFGPEINDANPVIYFIFEGIAEGEGTLAIVVQMADGTEVEVPMIPMKLSEITEMYEHWTVGDTINMSVEDIPSTPVKVEDSGTYHSESPEEDDCIVFVHGWRMLEWERRSFANTSYKRLWHQGYKGRFYHFSWPTKWTPRRTGVFWDWIGNPPEDAGNYADSEKRAYHSAEGLRQLLADLKTKHGSEKVRMFAHSMGGIVASEAMRLHSKTSGGGDLLHTFVACQASMAAHAYDSTAAVRPASALNMFIWDTPESYADYPFTSGTEFFNGITSAGAVVNFHNVEDDALDGWTKGQDLKPNYNIPSPPQ